MGNSVEQTLQKKCTDNAADAWCYSVLLYNEEHAIVFHCADWLTAQKCAKLAALGRFCNDEGTFCCCNNSGCMAILSYPFIKNNGTNFASVPSVVDHEVFRSSLFVVDNILANILVEN